MTAPMVHDFGVVQSFGSLRPFLETLVWRRVGAGKEMIQDYLRNRRSPVRIQLDALTHQSVLFNARVALEGFA